jgi:selenocysteine lyase/cysteine desulfurase
VTTTRVSLACGPFSTALSRSTRWSLPFGHYTTDTEVDRLLAALTDLANRHSGH